MTEHISPARRRLLGILSGSWVAQAVYALVKLGVPDLLRDGPRTVADLAAETGADRRILARLMRALTMLGLFRQTGPEEYALTSTTELLCTDVPGSVRLNALMHGEEVFQSFAEIMFTVRTGRPSFEKVFGQPFYDYLSENPEAAYTFNQSMGNQPFPAAITSCDLSSAKVIVDVGGGNGNLLIDLLKAHPQARGVLLELAEAILVAKERLAESGVDDRVECVEGSFFTEIPPGGDVYLLCRVLHNWADHNALAILKQVHAAMPSGARLFVLEDFLPEPDSDPGFAGIGGRSAAGMVDLLMLVTQEGCDRTEAEYRRLIAEAGFEVTGTPPTGGLVEARKP